MTGSAAGDITGWPLDRFTRQSRLRALVFAADHRRLEVIDLRDPTHHRTPLEEAQNGDSPGHHEVEALLRPPDLSPDISSPGLDVR